MIMDELQALDQALDEMIPGETIVVFFDCMKTIAKHLLELGAVPSEAPMPRVDTGKSPWIPPKCSAWL